jgi:hypothetical protein
MPSLDMAQFRLINTTREGIALVLAGVIALAPLAALTYGG